MSKEWHARRDLPWFKLYFDFLTTDSHVGVPGSALWCGVVMMMLANRWGRREDGSGWVLDKAGHPMRTEKIAYYAHLPVVDTEMAINTMLETGTMVRRADGVLGFPKLRKWQESVETERVRAWRKKKDSEWAEEFTSETEPQRNGDRYSNGRATRYSNGRSKDHQNASAVHSAGPRAPVLDLHEVFCSAAGIEPGEGDSEDEFGVLSALSLSSFYRGGGA